MDNNDELKEIDIKNCTCYYFDDIIKIEDFNLDNILTDEKSYENILVYKISYKNLIAKPLRYLVLFGSEKYDSKCKRWPKVNVCHTNIPLITFFRYLTNQ